MQVERWMDIFSDDEPDPMGLELVREFDSLAKKLYSNFEEGLNDWSKSSEMYAGIRGEVVKEEVNIILESSYPGFRPTKAKRSERKVEPVTVSARRHIDNPLGSRIEKVEQDSPEDVVVSDKNIKMVLRLPVNNRKENIKVVAQDDNSVSISYLNYNGKRCTRTLDIPYSIDFEMAKATYKNGILEVTFDRI